MREASLNGKGVYILKARLTLKRGGSKPRVKGSSSSSGYSTVLVSIFYYSCKMTF